MAVNETAISLLDSRVNVLISQGRRAAMTSLWQLDARLADVVRFMENGALSQIKLAWWRESLADLGAAATRGEPLLKQLAADWSADARLDRLAAIWDDILVAETVEETSAALRARGAWLFDLTERGYAKAGEGWSLVDGALCAADPTHAGRLFAEAAEIFADRRLDSGASRALRSVIRWARTVAQGGGKRAAGREAMLLLRIGVFGR